MVFDANVMFGFELEEDIDMSAGRVARMMDGAGISRALITNNRCKFSDFVQGNDETAALCRQSPERFAGLGSFNPAQFLDVKSEALRCVHQLGLAGLRVFNTSANFTSGWGGGLDSLVLEDALKAITDTGAIVFIEGGFSFTQVCAIADKFPGLRFIASGAGYGNMGEAIAAAGRRENIWLEISTLDTMDGVEILCRHIGAGRVVFGTGLPYNSPSCAKMMVTSANIPQSDKDLILGGNLERLLKGAN